jgi:hypothetical protein
MAGLTSNRCRKSSVMKKISENQSEVPPGGKKTGTNREPDTGVRLCRGLASASVTAL